MTRRVPWACLVLAAACGETTQAPVTQLNLDRPVDVAFACYGGLRLTGGDAVADPSDPVVETAIPMEACRIRSLDDDLDNDTQPDDLDPPLGVPDISRVPPGQEDLDPEVQNPVPISRYFAFVLQSVPGTVALATFPTEPPDKLNALSVSFVDAEPLVPGRNSIVVGSLPIAIAGDRAGCHMVTANAGSCDLSTFDVPSFVDGDEATRPAAERVTVVNAAGEPVLARPAALVAEPVEADQPIGVECPAEPEGLVWVAYPECHLVAAVRPATGAIEAGVRFLDDGGVELTDGDVSCAAQCGGGGAATPGVRPVTLDLVHDRRVGTRRLVIGADDLPRVTVVELDDDYLPVSASQVALEGEVGLTDIALSPQIGAGGSTGVLNDETSPGGQFQYVYGVATDGTVRVADVLDVRAECDTQVDPRYLRGEASINLLACLPVGGPETPPRRALARGPGIELVSGAVPLAVTFTKVAGSAAESGSVSPRRLRGHFAVITASNGAAVVVNVDDDAYGDFWNSLDPLGVHIPLAIPHQLRDLTEQRDALALTSEDEPRRVCDDDGTAGTGGPRLLGDDVEVGFDTDLVSTAYDHVLPGLRRLRCDDEVTGESTPLYETHFSMLPEVRDAVFPDLRAVVDGSSDADPSWRMTWEGAVSDDEAGQDIDGPTVRLAAARRDGSRLELLDGSRPFCSMGAQDYDIVELVGCDPGRDDADCGLGETCYVHPDATAAAAGACLPEAEAELLAGTCRDFLVSRRRYSVTSSTAGALRLAPRLRVLRSTPLDGCTGDDQCAQLAAYEASLASAEDPVDQEAPVVERSYACRPDPSRSPDLASGNRCVMTCESSADCDDATVCSSGVCVEGVVPPDACVGALQRYQLRVGEAYAVIGSATGFLHPLVEDEATSACVANPDASPLLVGRLPLTAPPCAGDGLVDLSPNPCATTVEHAELVPDYQPTAGDPCALGSNTGTLATRSAPAIRFRNPALTVHLVDPYYPGDAVCRQDRAGTLGRIPTVHPGTAIALPVTEGFRTLSLSNVSPVFPVNVVRGPEDSVWVIDAGDNVPDELSSVSTRGQVFRVEPSNLDLVNVIQ
jgi:hypothetical protein